MNDSADEQEEGPAEEPEAPTWTTTSAGRLRNILFDVHLAAASTANTQQAWEQAIGVSGEQFWEAWAQVRSLPSQVERDVADFLDGEELFLRDLIAVRHAMDRPLHAGPGDMRGDIKPEILRGLELTAEAITRAPRHRELRPSLYEDLEEGVRSLINDLTKLPKRDADLRETLTEHLAQMQFVLTHWRIYGPEEAAEQMRATVGKLIVDGTPPTTDEGRKFLESFASLTHKIKTTLYVGAATSELGMGVSAALGALTSGGD